MEKTEKKENLSYSREKRARISVGRYFLVCLIIFLFLLKIGSVIFIVCFPKSVFFAEISKGILLSLTNQERGSLGVSSLKESSKLNRAAYLKAKDMLANDYFAHTSPSGLSPWYWFGQAGYKYQYAGENLAIDFLDSEALFHAWDSSPSHRENIVSVNYTEVGLAVLSGEFEGAQTTVVVQLFGSPVRALAKEPTSPTSPTPSSQVPQPTTTPQVSWSGPTLCQYFIEKNGKCPSLAERATLYEKHELGPASTYQGTTGQNKKLLEALLKVDESEKPVEETETKEVEEVEQKTEEIKPEVAKDTTSKEINGSVRYKVLDYLANHYDNFVENTFFIIFALVIISLSFDFVGKISIDYSSLLLKGTFYTFVLVVLYSLNKETILRFIPNVLKIF